MLTASIQHSTNSPQQSQEQPVKPVEMRLKMIHRLDMYGIQLALPDVTFFMPIDV